MGLMLARFLVSLILVAGSALAQGLEGKWQGTLNAGTVQLRLALAIEKAADGTYSGTMDSLDQGATIPIDTITATGKKVRLELKPIKGVYDGSFSEDRSELRGTWTQNGTTLPLGFKRGAKPEPPKRPTNVEVDVQVPKTPTVVRSKDGNLLVYELHITNFGQKTLTLTGVEVWNDGKLVTLEGPDLKKVVSRPGATTKDPLKIAGGLRAVVYLWVEVDEVPAALRHRLLVKVGDYPESLPVDCARIAVAADAVTIGPPLRGNRWLAVNGPSNKSIHRRALLASSGGARIAQRFAIDFVRLQSDAEKTHAGEPKDNKNYRCYGVEALAVADAVVTSVHDGMPENVPGLTSRAVPVTVANAGGNHVILDLGSGHYAFYAHLQPGSLRVKVGDKVSRGQVLGLVGNSGNSTEPHLHFHVSDANSPLTSEGLPYVFESFETKDGKRTNEIPLQDEIVSFP